MAMASTPGQFQMHGARAALAGGLFHIEEQIKGIERAILENPGLAFDLAKTLVESACKTILTERTIKFASDDDLSKLFRSVTSQLPLLPTAASGQTAARRSLAQTLSGLHTAMQGVAELRNAYGFASHGADSQRPPMEGLQAVLAAEAADAIIGFLYGAHRQGLAARSDARLAYEDHETFNEYVDELNEVRIFDLHYRPSEVLFRIDHEAYRDQLSGYVPDAPAPDPKPWTSESSGAASSAPGVGLPDRTSTASLAAAELSATTRVAAIPTVAMPSTARRAVAKPLAAKTAAGKAPDLPGDQQSVRRSEKPA